MALTSTTSFNVSPASTPGRSGGGGGTLLYAVIGVLGLGALVFAILTMVFYSKANTATKTLESQKSAAVAKAKADQKKTDDSANALANESPYRSYVAPVEFGSFEIKFPKSWSSYVVQERQGTQVSLVVNPDFIRRTNGQDELAASRIKLDERPSDQYMTSFANQVKQGKLKQSSITVSGQKAFDLTGEFQDRKTTRQVIVPIRDKVLVFINENSRYAAQFNEILSQAKIIP